MTGARIKNDPHDLSTLKLGLTPWDFSDRSAKSLTAQAAFAESRGYESFWLPENHFIANALPDPLLLLAAVAAGTSKIKLATTSYLLPLRNPLLAAEQVAILDHLSNGRVILGVGRGYSKETLHAFDIQPSTKRQLFEWCLGIMTQAWHGEPVSLHEDGSSAVTLSPLPVQKPHPPVWVAAFGPKAIAQAGRLGLPYLASPIETFEQLRTNYDAYDHAIEASAHASPKERPVMRSVFVCDDKDKLKQVKDKLRKSKPPAGLESSPEIDDWAIVGDASYARDQISKLQDSLGATHLIITRLRIDGFEQTDFKSSLEKIAELVC